MEKYGESTKEFKTGQPVIYIPDHVKLSHQPYSHPHYTEMKHRDSQYGIVKSTNDKFVFVQFFPGLITGGKTVTAQSCRPENLYFNSEE